MLFRFIFLTIVFINSLALCANEKLLELSTNSNILSFRSFPVVFGWFHNDNSKWIVKKNEIKNIDKFTTFYNLSFYNNNKKWIAFLKEEKENNYSIYHIYFIDYEGYKKSINRRESNTLLKFPILKYKQIKVKNNDIVTSELLGFDDLSDCILYPRDSFVLQYKFFNDNTVKFLFYVDQCSAETCLVSALNTNIDYLSFYKIIGTEDLYDNFFYKTTTKYFIDFIDSPIK